MELKQAVYIFTQIKFYQLTELVTKLINSGIRYSRIRVDRFLLSPKERLEMGGERTIAHNAFIRFCDILARNMQNIGEDNSWKNILGSD